MSITRRGFFKVVAASGAVLALAGNFTLHLQEMGK